MAGNGTSLFNELIPDTTNRRSLSESFDLSRLAVTCLDSPPPESPEDFPTAEQLADEVLYTLEKVSVHFGASTGPTEPDGGCQFWPVRGPERFTGPWNATLETPMLIISNTVSWHKILIPVMTRLIYRRSASKADPYVTYGVILQRKAKLTNHLV